MRCSSTHLSFGAAFGVALLLLSIGSCSKSEESEFVQPTAPDLSDVRVDTWDAGSEVTEDAGNPGFDAPEVDEDVPKSKPCSNPSKACREPDGMTDPATGVCVQAATNEGGGCFATPSSVGSFDGICDAGQCIPLTEVCTDVDPDGCWKQVPGNGECLVENTANGTPCGAGGNWCLDGACAFAPQCGAEVLLHPGGQPSQFDGECAGNTGCTDVCVPNTCGCWACDGPFCVDAGCDDSSTGPKPDIVVSLDTGLGAEPVGGRLADPAPTLAADGSAEWFSEAGEYPILLLCQYQAPPATQAGWMEDGAPQSAAIEGAAIVANRLLVGRVRQYLPPCEIEPALDVDAEPMVLEPNLGDPSTVEFQLSASDNGDMAVVWIRVLQDTDGAYYYEWIHLGGWSQPLATPDGNPDALQASVRMPLPAAKAQPLEVLWPGFDWAAAVTP